MSSTNNAIQSDCQPDVRLLNSGADLTGMEGRLVVMQDGGSRAEVILPASQSALALFIVLAGEVEDKKSKLQSLLMPGNARILANGTGSAGAILVLADPSTPADKGKVITIPATEGVYFSPGIAEEDWVDEQHVKVRPFPRLVHVGAAFTVATPAATAATSSTPFGYTEAQANAILTNLRELRAWAIANGFKANNA